ncbi:unnamed protein product, partial [marine sediment metagenome]
HAIKIGLIKSQKGTKHPNTAGEKHPLAKLNNENIKEIRQRYSNGEKQKDIARDFNISQKQVSKIIRKERWKHVI